MTVLGNMGLGFWRLCQVLRKTLYKGLLRLVCLWPWLATAGGYLCTASAGSTVLLHPRSIRVSCYTVLLPYGHTYPQLHIRVCSHACTGG